LVIRFLDGGLDLVQPTYQRVERLLERLHPRGLIAMGRLRMGWAGGGAMESTIWRSKSRGHFFHNLRGNRIALVHEGTDQRTFAPYIGDSGNPAGLAVHIRNRFRAEYFGMFRAGDAQAFLDGASRFLEAELARPRAERDWLAELPEFRPIEFLLQLGLAREHDLQQFFGRRLQVRPQTDFLPHWRRQVLRLVSEQYGAFPSQVALQKPLVQFEEYLVFLPRFQGDTEIGHQEMEKLRTAEPGIKDQRG
jgi:hypothetical protein